MQKIEYSTYNSFFEQPFVVAQNHSDWIARHSSIVKWFVIHTSGPCVMCCFAYFFLVSTLFAHEILVVLLSPIESSNWFKISTNRMTSGGCPHTLEYILCCCLLLFIQIPNSTPVLRFSFIRRSMHPGPLNQQIFISHHIGIKFNQDCFGVVLNEAVCWIQLYAARISDDTSLNSRNSFKSELRSAGHKRWRKWMLEITDATENLITILAIKQFLFFLRRFLTSQD